MCKFKKRGKNLLCYLVLESESVLPRSERVFNQGPHPAFFSIRFVKVPCKNTGIICQACFTHFIFHFLVCFNVFLF